MRKWIPGFLILAGLTASVVVYPNLPATMCGDLSELLPFALRPECRTAPRALAAFGLPVVAIVLWIALHEAPARAPGRLIRKLFPAWALQPSGADVEYEKFSASYQLIVIWIVAIVIGVHVAMLRAELGWSVAPGLIIGLVFGFGMIVTGNVMPRLRRNPVAGIRTRSTMSDDTVWARAHRVFGALWVLGGIAVTGVALAAPRYALVAAVVVLLLSSVAMLVYPKPTARSTSRIQS